jgi:hypothetical protein
VGASLAAQDTYGPGDALRDVTSALAQLKEEYRDVILLRFAPRGRRHARVAFRREVQPRDEGRVRGAAH